MIRSRIKTSAECKSEESAALSKLKGADETKSIASSATTKHRRKCKVFVRIFAAVVAFGLYYFCYARFGDEGQGKATANELAPRGGGGGGGGAAAAATKATRIATVEQVAEFLSRLAGMPRDELEDALEESKGDVFQLSELESGQCPSPVLGHDWLPPRPPDEAARLFRDRNAPRRRQSRHEPVPLLWYEHLSKAGGTSFCELAGANMHKAEVPSYYCMPSSKADPDARVGLWSNRRLEAYVRDGAKRIVSNEWNPFDPARFDLAADPARPEAPRLLFVTTIRQPLDRLLSAYKFWGLLHGPRVKPTLTQWLNRRHTLARNARVPDFSVASHVGRYNFATWKFSNGTMPLSSSHSPDESLLPPSTINYEAAGDEWKIPFQHAVRNLSRFHLVMPLELLWKHSQSLKDVLGWTELREVHVVPSGKVVDTDAKANLPPDQYQLLWDANRLDIILYTWSKAVYLARIYCKT